MATGILRSSEGGAISLKGVHFQSRGSAKSMDAMNRALLTSIKR